MSALTELVPLPDVVPTNPPTIDSLPTPVMTGAAGFDGLSVLAWLVGLTFLWLMYRRATRMPLATHTPAGDDSPSTTPNVASPAGSSSEGQVR